MNWEKKYGDPLAHLFWLNCPEYTPYCHVNTRKIVPAGTKPVLLDGIIEDANNIDPQKHEYLGIFRPPSPPVFPDNIEINGTVHGHYINGDFDLLSYRTKK